MPRSFDLSAEYHASVEQVHAAFCDEAYWLARLADSGADTATLDSMTVEPDGQVAVTTTQALYRERLPALATQFHRGDLEVVRSETWSPVRGGKASAQVTGKVLAAPVSLSGEAELAPTETGCRLTFTATVHVDIPLVGGKIESIIGTKLSELMTAEQRFTTRWVADAG
ncbi:DUF2505 domain-containing protein [Mycobacterium sp. pUA109]|uniref:DUF2505 domain-containing protein n=1 Tax=Mycobacterium sp. pUA109 TaxID=3238982 RepID=UPI00351B4FFB